MDTPETSAKSPSDFRMLLFRASHAQKQLMYPFMASIGLGTGQPKLLSYLAEYGPSSPREMADFYELDPAGVSRMLDALEGKGFVKIEPHAEDRRSKVVSLTQEGARVACAWSAACEEEAEAMLRGFTPEEREAFADYLRRAHTNLRAYGSKLQASSAEAEANAKAAHAEATEHNAAPSAERDTTAAAPSTSQKAPAKAPTVYDEPIQPTTSAAEHHASPKETHRA